MDKVVKKGISKHEASVKKKPKDPWEMGNKSKEAWWRLQLTAYAFPVCGTGGWAKQMELKLQESQDS